MPEQQRASRGVAFRRAAPWRSLVSRACILLAILVVALGTRVAHAATYTGTVFEDVDYGGGAGRSLTTSAGVPLANVTVELYRVSNGNLIDTDTTNASGFYSLTSSGGTAALSMYVRVVNGTVRSSRAGGAACTTCVPVQTFRTIATSGAAVAVTDHVGGEVPGSSDAVDESWLEQLWNAHRGWPRAAVCHAGDAVGWRGHHQRHRFRIQLRHGREHTRRCQPAAATNSSYPCQGSLRQFIINANALGGEGALAPIGQRPDRWLDHHSCRADSSPAFS